PTTEEQLQQLKDKVQKLEEIIQQQQKIVEALQNQKKDASATPADAATTAVTPAVAPEATTGARTGVVTVATSSTAIKPNTDKPDDFPDSPLQFRLGSAFFTPVGFVDFTAVFRSTTNGSGGGTNFGAIPFNNTVPGHLSEFRFTAQNSRIGM